MKIEGGFLPALAGLIPFQTGPVLPALELGLYQDWQVQVLKKVIGNGLYLKNGSGVIEKGCILAHQAVKDLKL